MADDPRRSLQHDNPFELALARDAALADTPAGRQRRIEDAEHTERFLALIAQESQAEDERLKTGLEGNAFEETLARDVAQADTPYWKQRRAEEQEATARIAELLQAEQQAEQERAKTAPKGNAFAEALVRDAAEYAAYELSGAKSEGPTLSETLARMNELSDIGADVAPHGRNLKPDDDADTVPHPNDTVRASRAVYQFQIDSIRALRPKPRRRQRDYGYDR